MSFTIFQKNCSHKSWRLVSNLLVLILLLLSTIPGKAQEVKYGEISENDFELVLKAEADLSIAASQSLNKIHFARGAEKSLKEILQRSPETPLRSRILQDLKPWQEFLGQHNFDVALFFLAKSQGSKRHGLLGAESRLKEIVREYPEFSHLDEVLIRLAEVSTQLEKPDGPSYYLKRLVCECPASSYSEKAFSQLYQVGIDSWDTCEALKLKPLP